MKMGPGMKENFFLVVIMETVSSIMLTDVTTRESSEIISLRGTENRPMRMETGLTESFTMVSLQEKV